MPTTSTVITGTAQKSRAGISPLGEAPAHAHSGRVGKASAKGSHEKAVYFSLASYKSPPPRPIIVSTLTHIPKGRADPTATNANIRPTVQAARGLIAPVATGLSTRPASISR